MSEKDHVTHEARRIMQRFPNIFGPGPWAGENNGLLAYGFECGPGWYPLLERLCSDLSKIVQEDDLKEFQVIQVKQKLGTLRFYVRGGSARTFDRIRKGEREAADTCERCGTRPAKLYSLSGFLVTCCEKCKAEIVHGSSD